MGKRPASRSTPTPQKPAISTTPWSTRASKARGLSKPLIKAALEDESTVGKRVIASCSAVAGFIEKNPEYQHLLEN